MSVPFNGEAKSYERWSFKFLGIAQTRGFKDLLTGDEKCPPKDTWC